MGGNSLSNLRAPIDHQVGIGTSQETSKPKGAVWYYDISNFFLTIVCNLNYWNYFESCGPFDISGCPFLGYNLYAWYAKKYPGNPNIILVEDGFIKAAWVLIDIFSAFFLLVGGTILGYFASEIALIPEFIYDILSFFEGLLTPLITIFADIFGDLLTFFETGATYILQFLGFSGSLAGQSLFGIGKDLVDSFNARTGIPEVLLYVLLAEIILEIFLKIMEKYSSDPEDWNCFIRGIYRTFDTPFEWLTGTIFKKGIFHVLLELLFSPFRILIGLFSILFGTIYCDTIGSESCGTITC